MFEVELEKQIRQKFIDAGWDAIEDYGTKAYRPDITLSYQQKVMGYVEVICYREGNEKFLLKKLEQAKQYINIAKPIIFIVTDGNKYHVSIKGGPFEVIHFPPGPESYYVGDIPPPLIEVGASCAMTLMDQA